MTNPAISALVARVRAAAPQFRDTRLVLIDGQAGAGKTTLANRLTSALAGAAEGDPSGAGSGGAVVTGSAGTAQLLHGDDMYEGWSGLATLHEVLVEQILEPLARGEAGAFRVWDWENDRRAHEVAVPPREFLVIEGVGVGQAAARHFASLTVFVDAPAAIRLERGIARDGEQMRGHWERWQAEEEAFHALDGMPAAADVVVAGTAPVPD